MTKVNKILIITSSCFPNGDAEAVRLHTFAKILRDLGNIVNIISNSKTDYRKKMKYDGFDYVSYKLVSANYFSKLYNFIKLKYLLNNIIIDFLSTNDVDIILYADLMPFIISDLKKICREKNIQLVADCVEWYSPNQFKFGFFSPSMIFKNIENKFLIDKKVKVICISKYLKKYFNERTLLSVRIPAILDVLEMPKNLKLHNDKLNLFYAGTPGKKDYLIQIMRAILELDNQYSLKIEFNIVGIKKENIRDNFNDNDYLKLDKNIRFHGRLDRNIVLEMLIKSDFTILIRSSESRYAKAGFPTKFVESLASGTPIILNLSSDIGEFVVNDKEVIIVENTNSYEISKAIIKAINLNENQLNDMKDNARICAERNFDYRLYYREFDLLTRK